jgi:fimbrial chaperone protein
MGFKQMTHLSSQSAARRSAIVVTAGAIAAGALALMSAGAADAQSLTVLPVTIQMTPGQLATTLTVINQADAPTAVQIRVFAWNQHDGADSDQLVATTDTVVASPPLATIAPSAAQIVRLVLRKPPQGQESAYRVLIDQIPPAAVPGTVQMALRLSIPIFAEPAVRAAAHVRFHLERTGRDTFLVASNDGNRHEAIRDIVLTTSSGGKLQVEANSSPYILAGATRRWRIVAPPGQPAATGSLRLTARSEGGNIDQLMGGGVASAP